MTEALTVHYSSGETGRACGTWGGMRTRDRSEVTCAKCQKADPDSSKEQDHA